MRASLILRFGKLVRSSGESLSRSRKKMDLSSVPGWRRDEACSSSRSS